MSFRIRVFDSRIHAMSMDGGMIYRWTARITREIMVEAAMTAPLAKQDWGPGHFPGRLKGSHSHNTTGNQYGVFGSVKNSAPYAKFVHEGTHTPITAKGKFIVDGVAYMKFVIDGTPYRREWVQGQASQPWLADAQVAVLARHQIY